MIKKEFHPTQIEFYTNHSLDLKKNLQFLNFKSCENVPSSDHKPVYCDFLLQTTDGGNSIIKNCRNNGIKFEIYSCPVIFSIRVICFLKF